MRVALILKCALLFILFVFLTSDYLISWFAYEFRRVLSIVSLIPPFHMCLFVIPLIWSLFHERF